MIKLYYWNFVKNFGDQLSPWLCEQVFNQQTQHTGPELANLAAIGSILHKLPAGYGGHIWGSGILDGATVLLPKAKVHCVRGRLTNRYMMGKHPIGDPALLVSRYIHDNGNPIWEYGIIPHYSEKNSPLVKKLCSREDTYCIDPQLPVADVIAHILLCKYIISSSLHGIIVADSFSIPNVWTRFTTSSGIGQFKFFDYFGTVGRTPRYTALEENSNFDILPWEVINPEEKIIVQESILRNCPEL